MDTPQTSDRLAYSSSDNPFGLKTWLIAKAETEEPAPAPDPVPDEGVTVTIGNGQSFTGTPYDDHITAGDRCYQIYGLEGNDIITVGDYAGERFITEQEEAAVRRAVAGGMGSDIIKAGYYATWIEGGEGNDSITFTDDAFSIRGGPGDDIITGKNNALDIYGDEPSPTSIFDIGNDIIQLGDSAHRIYGGGGNDSITIGNDSVIIHGDSGDDEITTEDNCTMIYGDAGDDTIQTGDYCVIIEGGANDDIITTGDSCSHIYGDAGDDTIRTGDFCSYVDGDGNRFDHSTDGNDTIIMGSYGGYVYGPNGPYVPEGSYAANGGSGNDHIETGEMTVGVYGGEGDDIIDVGDSSSEIYGGDGNDIITGALNCDAIYGGDGDDHITLEDGAGSWGYGTISGDEGDDTISVGDNCAEIYGGAGDDEISVGNDGKEIYGGEGNDRITVGANCQTIHGDAGEDEIIAGIGASIIYGDAGDDAITTEAGASWIHGGIGNDKISVGDNSTYIYGDEGNDQITAGDNCNRIRGGDGDDIIIAGIGAANINGNEGNDTISAKDNSGGIHGDAGDDIIDVGSNAFRIFGDDGNDRITAGDYCAEVDGGAGDDEIIMGDYAGLTHLEPPVPAPVYGAAGGEGNDRISAGDHALYIYGDGSNDQISVGHESQYIYGGDGNDLVSAGDDAQYIYGGDGNDLVSAGDDAQHIYGEDGNDLISAGDNAKEIDGGAGDDTIIVGDNADGIALGSGNDILVSNYTANISSVTTEGGINIIAGNASTLPLDQMKPEYLGTFSALLRGLTDDILPLDFNSWERLGDYGIYAGSETNPIILSPVWTLARTTPALDIYKSFQNGTELELELWNKKDADFVHMPVIREKMIGESIELNVIPDYYTIASIDSQGQYGQVIERDGHWFYQLSSAADSGPEAGANIVRQADTVAVSIVNPVGQVWHYDIAIDLEDDVPEIATDAAQEYLSLYFGADGGSLTIFANDQPVQTAASLEDGLVIEGKYGSLHFGPAQADSAFGLTTSLAYVPGADTSGTDVFRFQITDNDGDMAMQSVAFSAEIPEPGSPVASIDQLTFHEQNLVQGTAPDYIDLVRNGAMLYTQNSGIQATQIRFEGQTYNLPASGFFNLTTSEGVFSAWQNPSGLSYSFILANSLAQAGDAELLKFEAILADSTGNIFDGNMININIIDDRPVLLEDKVWQLDAQNSLASGNATEYFMAGADGGLFSWRVSAEMLALANEYGKLTLADNGAYTFELNDAPAETLEPLALAWGFEDIDGDALSGAVYINF